jgi:hypothetical protein
MSKTQSETNDSWYSFDKLKKRVLDSGWFMSHYFVVDMKKIIQHTEELLAEKKILSARIEELEHCLVVDLSRTDRDAIYRHDLDALINYGGEALCHTHIGTMLIGRMRVVEAAQIWRKQVPGSHTLSEQAELNLIAAVDAIDPKKA